MPAYLCSMYRGTRCNPVNVLQLPHRTGCADSTQQRSEFRGVQHGGGGKSTGATGNWVRQGPAFLIVSQESLSVALV